MTPAVANERPLFDGESIAAAFKLLMLDFIVLALQGSVMSHFQTSLFTCNLALLIAISVGFRQGPIMGAGHGLLLGWMSGALMGEPTGIPILLMFLVGLLASVVRHNFQVELLIVRVWLMVGFILLAGLVGIGLHVALWQALPSIAPFSVVIYALLAPLADLLTGWMLGRG